MTQKAPKFNARAVSPAPVIAIDGPVASGKSAVGLQVSRHLGYRLVDTGMMYRAVTWLALQDGTDLANEARVIQLAEVAQIDLAQPDSEGVTRISANGTDITGELRQPEVDRGVSFVSRIPDVRKAMVRLQRELAGQGSLIMLGRDIGSVVLPDAPLKIYLDASPRERAHRRFLELAEAGSQRPEVEILAELEQRDQMDRQRHVSPLHPVADAVIIDTDGVSLPDVVQRVLTAALAEE